MSREKAIEKIQYAVMQVASVYACSSIFDEKTKVIEGRQKELEKAIVNLHDALKELEEWKMSVLISPEAYKKILQGDLDWLLKQPESLEKDHIEAILKNIIKRIEEGKEF